ncbi:MAG: ADP-ribosylglycohydrolase family protein [Candidatus Methanoplasma sp.]|jgi:ADP-ribosylglycohydrolase|nr:ADP-ribosylglycohydrolase family protein [Candidatus Methanoplasma sp.]
MLGAMVGDIIGSVYEWNNIRTKDFPLFAARSFFTDDTVMTIAVAEALMNGGKSDDFIDAMKKWGRKYPSAGYGMQFGAWLDSDSREPYNSWGNGSAMRVSPVGFFVDLRNIETIDRESLFAKVRELSMRSAETTHNHPEGIKGAQAVADAILHMRLGREVDGNVEERKASLGSLIEARYGYDLSRTLDEIRPAYSFNESCQETVPEAITAFIESTDFEDAIRNAVSLGGDSDTLAAITGGIAEAAYGIPKDIADRALGYLDASTREAYDRWCGFLMKN